MIQGFEMSLVKSILCFLLLKAVHCQYTADWSSLDTRPLPQWYDDVKFGIFNHFGLYSVPSYQSEWFWWDWKGAKEAPLEYFMKKNYRPDYTYPNFGEQFTAEFFNASEFAEIIKKSGAQYYILTSKHHEGFTMWPSNYSWNWNAMNVGPHRDIVGELSEAIRKAGLHFGLYYSLFEWFNPIYLKDKVNGFSSQEYVRTVVNPQLQEIISHYKPEVIWSDGDWEASWTYWNSTEFIAWLYNESPVKDTVVTNDRWGVGTNCEHGDFYTCADRYNPGHLLPHKWENAFTVDSQSWGFRREARYEDFLSIQDLIYQMASTISCGGNLLMNVGPAHYGRITPIFEERLNQMGQFVNVNQEGIFKTKPWIYQNDTVSPNIWYVSKVADSTGLHPRRLYNPQLAGNTVVYAFLLVWPTNGILYLGAPKGTSQTKISMLGYDGQLQFKINPPGGISIDLTGILWNQLPNAWSWVIKLENLDDDDTTPKLFNGKQFIKAGHQKRRK